MDQVRVLSPYGHKNLCLPDGRAALQHTNTGYLQGSKPLVTWRQPVFACCWLTVEMQETGLSAAASCWAIWQARLCLAGCY